MIDRYMDFEIKRTVRINNEEETKSFAEQLADEAAPGQIIALKGDLGTGKTTLTRYIAKRLGVTENITSPTFTIVKEYDSGRIPLYHFDVYRIGDPDEMFEIGYEEYFFGKGLCVIEWADLIEELLPETTRFIEIEYGQKADERIYKCSF